MQLLKIYRDLSVGFLLAAAGATICVTLKRYIDYINSLDERIDKISERLDYVSQKEIFELKKRLNDYVVELEDKLKK